MDVLLNGLGVPEVAVKKGALSILNFDACHNLFLC
jgi:hypothetical protein